MQPGQRRVAGEWGEEAGAAAEPGGAGAVRRSARGTTMRAFSCGCWTISFLTLTNGALIRRRELPRRNPGGVFADADIHVTLVHPYADEYRARICASSTKTLGALASSTYTTVAIRFIAAWPAGPAYRFAFPVPAGWKLYAAGNDSLAVVYLVCRLAAELTSAHARRHTVYTP